MPGCDSMLVSKKLPFLGAGAARKGPIDPQPNMRWVKSLGIWEPLGAPQSGPNSDSYGTRLFKWELKTGASRASCLK